MNYLKPKNASLLCTCFKTPTLRCHNPAFVASSTLIFYTSYPTIYSPQVAPAFTYNTKHKPVFPHKLLKLISYSFPHSHTHTNMQHKGPLLIFSTFLNFYLITFNLPTRQQRLLQSAPAARGGGRCEVSGASRKQEADYVLLSVNTVAPK